MEGIFSFLAVHRFYVGLAIGLFVGALIGILAIALCFVSGDSMTEEKEIMKGYQPENAKVSSLYEPPKGGTAAKNARKP